MLKAGFEKYTLQFKRPAGTSRGVLLTKDSWFIKVWDNQMPGCFGLGECSIIEGLSPDPLSEIKKKLTELTANISNWEKVNLKQFPAIAFGLETALRDLAQGGNRLLFESDFTNGSRAIPINGLIWMGDYRFMRKQIIQKIEQGFDCIKLKIGAIGFDKELALLKLIRRDFRENELELRVDANGAFSPKTALEKLKRLSQYVIHSIEQPIKQGQWEAMARLCESSPVPIALDEELIALPESEIGKMLDQVKPQYIILKPSLLGGWGKSKCFIEQAGKRHIGWWVTSALESNIGLNAIAQWTAVLNNPLPQGLGTGQLYVNNFASPLFIRQGHLFFDSQNSWELSFFKKGFNT